MCVAPFYPASLLGAVLSIRAQTEERLDGAFVQPGTQTHIASMVQTLMFSVLQPSYPQSSLTQAQAHLFPFSSHSIRCPDLFSSLPCAAATKNSPGVLWQGVGHEGKAWMLKAFR